MSHDRLAEYYIPAQMDAPEIDLSGTDIPDPRTPTSARGIGEIGITDTGAAIANAIYNAIGKRIRDVPIALDKLPYPLELCVHADDIKIS